MLRYLHIIGWIWLSCTGPVITWRLTKVYIVSVVICTSKELVNGRRIDNDRNFYFSQSPGHLLTVYQAISWLSVRPSTDCLLDPSVQDQTMMENQSLNFKSPRFFTLIHDLLIAWNDSPGSWQVTVDLAIYQIIAKWMIFSQLEPCYVHGPPKKTAAWDDAKRPKLFVTYGARCRRAWCVSCRKSRIAVVCGSGLS